MEGETRATSSDGQAFRLDRLLATPAQSTETDMHRGIRDEQVHAT